MRFTGKGETGVLNHLAITKVSWKLIAALRGVKTPRGKPA